MDYEKLWEELLSEITEMPKKWELCREEVLAAMLLKEEKYSGKNNITNKEELTPLKIGE